MKSNVHQSIINVTPTSGRRWIQMTDGKHWDDKPRWSPDGRTIYYVSERRGFFNVWGVHFDPLIGKPQGEPFQVTHFDNPKLMVGEVIPNLGFAVAQDKLMLTMEQLSGSIWVLDNAER